MIALLLLSLLAERFDHSSSPTYKKYLPLPNQLHFWTGHIQSIVKVQTKVGSPGGNSKVGWRSLFSNSVGRMVGLDGLSGFSSSRHGTCSSLHPTASLTSLDQI